MTSAATITGAVFVLYAESRSLSMDKSGGLSLPSFYVAPSLLALALARDRDRDRDRNRVTRCECRQRSQDLGKRPFCQSYSPSVFGRLRLRSRSRSRSRARARIFTKLGIHESGGSEWRICSETGAYMFVRHVPRISETASGGRWFRRRNTTQSLSRQARANRCCAA